MVPSVQAFPNELRGGSVRIRHIKKRRDPCQQTKSRCHNAERSQGRSGSSSKQGAIERDGKVSERPQMIRIEKLGEDA